MGDLTIKIANGKATVTADGTPVSCKLAHDVEKVLGQVTKTTPTGTRPAETKVVQG